MKIWQVLTSAVTGWRLILQGDAGWREHFRLTPAGLGTALALFAFIAFLAVALASTTIGMPNVIGILAAMFVLAFPITALVVSLLVTRMLLRSDAPVLPVLVPGVYATIAFTIVEALLAMIGGPVVMLSWLALGYLLFHLARLANGWNLGVAAGFAVLTVLLLVVMRMALYMLTNPAGSPI